MDVLTTILNWSKTRPLWQRDALRRLLVSGTLSDGDVEQLVRLCKVPHGLDAGVQVIPLSDGDIPNEATVADVVNLKSVVHDRGVNALAPEQKIDFGPNLTIVYGDNAAGKSGFSRILKRGCRARGAEDILGNVFSDQIPVEPTATIHFTVGSQEEQFQLGQPSDDDVLLRRVSVFDTRSAAVYLNERTDVAFRPFGLDLIDKLADVCERVHRRLEAERHQLSEDRPLPRLPEGTEAGSWTSKLTILSDPDEGKRLAQISDGDRSRLKQIEQMLFDRRSADPAKLANVLVLKAQRLGQLTELCRNANGILSQKSCEETFQARAKQDRSQRLLQELQSATFNGSALAGIGSETWGRLWEAARDYSVQHAYPGQHFPIVEDDARCVLCHQELDSDALERLRRFDAYIKSSAQQEYQAARHAYETCLSDIKNIYLDSQEVTSTIEELKADNEQLANLMLNTVDEAKQRRTAVVVALQDGEDRADTLPLGVLPVEALIQEISTLESRAEALKAQPSDSTIDVLEQEFNNLKARLLLSDNLEVFLAEIERKKQLAAFDGCLKDTDTTGITRKGTELTKEAVTDQLVTAFRSELDDLGLRHLRVEIRPVGGAQGVAYHQVVLKDAPQASLGRVASEGEARVLSLAAFFAELTTAPDGSAILFDDPVSSVDHYWRDNIAHRLVKEAGKRQVIVFTHDVMFLWGLLHWAEQLGVDVMHQHLRREAFGAGISTGDLPWVAMKVRRRIGVLKQQAVEAERTFNTAPRAEYEQKAILIYGNLRESWERALEEVLLNGVVERFRPSIETKRARILVDIAEEDYRTLDDAMTKASRWLPGHDQPGADNSPVPEPQELRSDVEILDEWVKGIMARRK